MAKIVAIRNLDKCLSKLGKIGKVDCSQPIENGATLIQQTAQNKAPYDTGLLAGSIKRKPYKGGTFKNGAVVYTNIPYAYWQEFGASGPHFVPVRANGKETGIRAWAIRHGIKEASNPKWGGMRVSGKAQPFMLPAFNEKISYVQRMVKDYIKAYTILTSKS